MLTIHLLVLVTGLARLASSVSYSLETKFIEVPVDHFSATPTKKTFPLRYLISAKEYAKNGPIFVYTGGERDISVTAENAGFFFEIAPVFKSLLVFIEHRYYGKSLPFGNGSFSSVENLRYLTVTQSLADFAFVIRSLKQQFLGNVSDSETPPVFTFGGYYAGMSAGWMRMKYPFLVKGALTFSAPLLNTPELGACEGFYDRVTTIFEKNGREQCVKTIKLGWDVINNLSKSKLGLDFMSSSWKLCRKLRSYEDVQVLLDWLSANYVKMSMTNYHYPSTYYNPVPAYPVKIFCDKLTTALFKDTKSFVESYAKALEVFTNYTGTVACNNIYFYQEDYNEIAWKYQSCTELVMPRCSTDKDMFINKRWNYEQYAVDCYKIFGVSPRNDFVTFNFGGMNLNEYNRIFFSNSPMDPGAWGGVYINKTTQPGDPLIAYKVPDCPHLMDLRNSDIADSNYIIRARQFYVQVLKKWLKLE